MQNINKIKTVLEDRDLIQRANDFIETNIEQFENINANFAYCVEDDVFIADLDIGYTDYTTKQYILFNQFKGELISCGIAFQGHLPLSMKANPIISLQL